MNKKKTILLVIAACLLVAALSAGFMYWFLNREDFFDENATDGQLPFKTAKEIQAELDRRIAESAFAISINTRPEFENGKAEGRLAIENVPNNHYNMRVAITLEDGTKIYQSGALKPGQYILDDTLDKNLKKGTYKATATFTAYEIENNRQKGQAAAEMEITIKN